MRTYAIKHIGNKVINVCMHIHIMCLLRRITISTDHEANMGCKRMDEQKKEAKQRRKRKEKTIKYKI